MVRIALVCINGTVKRGHIEHQQTIADAMRKLNIPAHNSIALDGATLDPDRTVSSYGIIDGDELHVSAGRSGKSEPPAPSKPSAHRGSNSDKTTRVRSQLQANVTEQTQESIRQALTAVAQGQGQARSGSSAVSPSRSSTPQQRQHTPPKGKRTLSVRELAKQRQQRGEMLRSGDFDDFSKPSGRVRGESAGEQQMNTNRQHTKERGSSSPGHQRTPLESTATGPDTRNSGGVRQSGGSRHNQTDGSRQSDSNTHNQSDGSRHNQSEHSRTNQSEVNASLLYSPKERVAAELTMAVRSPTGGVVERINELERTLEEQRREAELTVSRLKQSCAKEVERARQHAEEKVALKQQLFEEQRKEWDAERRELASQVSELRATVLGLTSEKEQHKQFVKDAMRVLNEESPTIFVEME